MYQKVKSFFKKMAASKNLKALAIMLLCGVGSVYAQTTAGDYSAGKTIDALMIKSIAPTNIIMAFLTPSSPIFILIVI